MMVIWGEGYEQANLTVHPKASILKMMVTWGRDEHCEQTNFTVHPKAGDLKKMVTWGERGDEQSKLTVHHKAIVLKIKKRIYVKLFILFPDCWKSRDK